MLEHGGNLDSAIKDFGGNADGWIDLSTGINRQPYAVQRFRPGIGMRFRLNQTSNHCSKLDNRHITPTVPFLP